MSAKTHDRLRFLFLNLGHPLLRNAQTGGQLSGAHSQGVADGANPAFSRRVGPGQDLELLERFVELLSNEFFFFHNSDPCAFLLENYHYYIVY